jgi:hypothetical protein
MIEGYDITPHHAQRLQKFLSEPLDLDKYDYQLECFAVPVYGPGTPPPVGSA